MKFIVKLSNIFGCKIRDITYTNIVSSIDTLKKHFLIQHNYDLTTHDTKSVKKKFPKFSHN